MTSRVDPPHDRVSLSPDELAAFRRLVDAAAALELEATEAELRGMSVRSRALSALFWSARLAPVAFVAGLVVMLVALPSAPVVSLLGAGAAAISGAAVGHRQGRRLTAWIRRADRGR